MNQLFIFIPIAISAMAFPVQLFALERSPKNNSVAIFHAANIERDLVAQNDTDFFLAQDSFNRGKRKLSRQDYQGAIEEFNQASIEDPNNTDVYFCRGSAYSQLKKHESVIADYSQAISLDSQLAEAYYCLGLVQVKQGNKEEAIANLKTAANLAKFQGKNQLRRNALNQLRHLH